MPSPLHDVFCAKIVEDISWQLKQFQQSGDASASFAAHMRLDREILITSRQLCDFLSRAEDEQPVQTLQQGSINRLRPGAGKRRRPQTPPEQPISEEEGTIETRRESKRGRRSSDFRPNSSPWDVERLVSYLPCLRPSMTSLIIPTLRFAYFPCFRYLPGSVSPDFKELIFPREIRLLTSWVGNHDIETRRKKPQHHSERDWYGREQPWEIRGWTTSSYRPSTIIFLRRIISRRYRRDNFGGQRILTNLSATWQQLLTCRIPPIAPKRYTSGSGNGL